MWVVELMDSLTLASDLLQPLRRTIHTNRKANEHDEAPHLIHPIRQIHERL